MSDKIGLAYPTQWGPQNPYAEPRHGHWVPELLGDLERITPPTGAVATLTEVKDQCNVDFTDADAILTDILGGATELAEDTIDGKRQLLTATFDAPCRGWWGRELQLPRPPLQSVTYIQYFDSAGNLQTLATSNYTVRTPWRGPGRIQRAPNVVFPPLQRDNEFPVTIRFVCGYGAEADVPLAAKRAILMICDHAFRYRGGDDEQGKSSALEIPPAALNLLRSLSWGSVF